MSFSTDGKGKKLDDPKSAVWYHGSPARLLELAAGSSITRSRDLAIAFSHKPATLSVSDNGRVSHDGKAAGFLYEVDEPVHRDDISIHPACPADDPWEWITRRPLRLRMISE